jgi:hypothetical protein
MKSNMKIRNVSRDLRQARTQFAQVPKPIASQGDIVTKRLTYNYLVDTSGAGIVGINAYLSGACQSLPATEWASFAARYQQYRVKALTITGCMTSTLGVVLVMADYLGASTPSSATQIVSDERCIIRSPGSINGSNLFVYETDWTRNPNAKLWNPTSAVVPTANEYGIALAGHPQQPATGTNTPVAIITAAWLVEFRGSQ